MAYSVEEAKAIGNFCQIIDCEHKTAPYVDSSPYLVVRTSNVRNGQLVFNDIKFTTKDSFKEWTQRTTPEYGDVLFTREAPAGETCLVPDGLNICMGQRMVLLRPNREKTNPIFLSLVLATRKCKNDILRLSIGSTVSRINIADIRKLRIPSPPLPEQKKIARILSSWDKAIKTVENLIENSKAQKKALMQQLLTGKRRLPRFEKEWKNTTLEKLIVESRIPGTTGDIAQKITIKLYGQGVVPKNEKRQGSQSTKYYKRKAGQFIYSKLDFLNGAFGIIPKKLDGFESTLDLPAFDFKTGVEPVWFINFVSREAFYSANLSLANGGRKARRVNPKDLLNLKVLLPSYPEQQEIASLLTAADKEIATLQQKLDCFKQEKSALMQQLLTGKRRVKVDTDG